MVGKWVAFGLVTIAVLGLGFLAAMKYAERQVVGKYAPRKLVPVTPRDPAEDFGRLRAMVRGRGGELVASDDTVVRYRDTKWFRLYELAHHSVVIFPYDWTDQHFELVLFAGHVRSYENLFRAVQLVYNAEAKEYRNETMDLDPTVPLVQTVGFDGFFLGTLRETVIDTHTSYLRAIGAQQLNMDIRDLTAFPGDSWGEKSNVRFRILYQDGRVAYMRHIVMGMPSVFEQSLSDPVLPVLAEGEFPVARH